MSDRPGLAALDFEVVEHELFMPFAISTGDLEVARAVIVRLELDDGTVGLGEGAPFPAVSGETVESTLAVLEGVRSILGALDPNDATTAVEDDRLHAAFADAPAARCGLEVALLDAQLRSAGRSIADWKPPRADHVVTDMTLPICAPDEALPLVADIVDRGFTTLKVKVGGQSVEADVDLLHTIAGAHPDLRLLLDANCAYDLDTSRRLLALLDERDVTIDLLEQPMPRDALAEMAELQADTRVPIGLDESIRGVDDLDRILRHPPLRSVNVKTTKMGLFPAVAVLDRARAGGLDCMIGCMIETMLNATVSAALAAHYADVVRHVDLDAPLFMGPGRVAGGITYDGERITLPTGTIGHGCTLAPPTGVS